MSPPVAAPVVLSADLPPQRHGTLPDAHRPLHDALRERVRWRENLPFWGAHVVAVAGAVWLGFSWTAAAWVAGSYLLRMFAVTGIYHRYFSHHSYKTSRPVQLAFALLGVTAVQKGPLWWAAHHRRHHKYSDTAQDIHSPRQRGFWYSHVKWILVEKYKDADLSNLKDFNKYPELRFVDKHEQWFVVAFATALYFIGGPVALVYGFFVSTVFLWHGTFTINSLCHVWGKPRYRTGDDSRNNFWLALLTLGEGWHNNHHYYQRSTRQGFYWWEIDITYYVLKLLALFRIVWDVQGVPSRVRDSAEHKLDARPRSI